MGLSDFQRESAARLFARAASCDVTPRDRSVRLAGYASRTSPVSTILDPIEISVILIESFERRCLIFSFDLMTVGSELQKMILLRTEQLGFRSDDVVLLASHTHGAPATDLACARLGIPEIEFVGKLAEAAENLVREIDAQPRSEICLDVFQGTLSHSINRRRYWPFPTFGRTYGFRLTSMAFAPNLSGPRDERATVVLLRKADDGQPLGVLWHYTCHPTAVVPDDVISADYPGVVRRALRQRFGEIPCAFALGFCGDIRPDIPISKPAGMHKRLRRMVRTLVSGPAFASPSSEDWTRWSQSLATKLYDIVKAGPARRLWPAELQTGSAQIPLSDFFEGSAPDKPLVIQIIRLGDALEIVAMSAEPCVGWERILDEAAPLPAGRIRLYSGYLGALFGYLPTTAQIPEGGYEVEAFQPLFGLSGHFESEKIGPAVIDCAIRAFEDLDRRKRQDLS